MKLHANDYVADLSAMPATAVLPMLCKIPIGRKRSKNLDKNEYKRLMYVKNQYELHPKCN